MGPTLFVYLPQLLSGEDKESIDVWLAKHTLFLQRRGTQWQFNFTKESCTCTLAIVPFGAESAGNGTATDVYIEDDKRLEYEVVLGYCPVESLQLDNFCREVLNFCESNFHRPLSTEQLAEMMHFSHTHFCEVFAREVGMPPATYLRHLRVQHAQKLLIEMDYGIADIARLSGFSNATQLGRAFKKAFGVSPLDFRKQQKTSSGRED